MARKRRIKINPSAMLIGAAQRVEMPVLPARISYDETTDTLYLKFRDTTLNRIARMTIWKRAWSSITTTAHWSALKCLGLPTS